MSIRPPSQMKTMGQEEATNLNQAITRVYSSRLESVNKRDSSAINQYLWQVVEYGEITMSANGSAVASVTYPFSKAYNSVIYANAHAISTVVDARVTDVTNSQISITMIPISGTGQDLSDVTTASIKVFFKAILSDP